MLRDGIWENWGLIGITSTSILYEKPVLYVYNLKYIKNTLKYKKYTLNYINNTQNYIVCTSKYIKFTLNRIIITLNAYESKFNLII